MQRRHPCCPDLRSGSADPPRLGRRPRPAITWTTASQTRSPPRSRNRCTSSHETAGHQIRRRWPAYRPLWLAARCRGSPDPPLNRQAPQADNHPVGWPSHGVHPARASSHRPPGDPNPAVFTDGEKRDEYRKTPTSRGEQPTGNPNNPVGAAQPAPRRRGHSRDVLTNPHSELIRRGDSRNRGGRRPPHLPSSAAFAHHSSTPWWRAVVGDQPNAPRDAGRPPHVGAATDPGPLPTIRARDTAVQYHGRRKRVGPTSATTFRSASSGRRNQRAYAYPH